MGKQENTLQVGKGKYTIVESGEGWAVVEVAWQGKRKADGEEVSGTTTARVATTVEAIPEVYGDRALDLLGRQQITDAANRARAQATEGKSPEESAETKRAKMSREEKAAMLRLLADDPDVDLSALGLR